MTYRKKINIAQVEDFNIANLVAGQAIVWDGNAFVNDTISVDLGLGDLSNVDLTGSTPSNGELLQFNGTNWVNADPLADYVTIATAQTVTGFKTFTNGLKTNNISQATADTRLEIDNTGGRGVIIRTIEPTLDDYPSGLFYEKGTLRTALLVSGPDNGKWYYQPDTNVNSVREFLLNGDYGAYNDELNQQGLLLLGFGETAFNNATGADYSTLLDTALIPKKWATDNLVTIDTAQTITGAKTFTEDVITGKEFRINSDASLSANETENFFRYNNQSTDFVGLRMRKSDPDNYAILDLTVSSDLENSKIDFRLDGDNSFSFSNLGIYIQNQPLANTPPVVTGEACLYIDAGALKFRSAGGTVTTLGTA